MINSKNWFQLRPMYNYIARQAENKKFLRYLEIGATFTLIAFFLFFAIMPTITAISSLLGEIKSKEDYIVKCNTKIANISKAQKTYTQIEDKYSTIEESFPSQPEYYKGASNLATLFRDSSLDINQINFKLNSDTPKKSNTTSDFFQTYEINISGEGQYSSIIDVVKKMISNRRLINTSSIQIRRILNSDNSNSNKIKISSTNNLYFLSDN